MRTLLQCLSNQFSSTSGSEEGNRKRYAMFGLLITLGVIFFMFLMGLLFTTIFQVSLTNVIGIVSPIAFGILAIVSLLLIFNVDFGKFLPQAKLPRIKNPVFNALAYGFFFGAIVIPCNPGFITVFLARTALINNFFSSMVNFISFGLGLGFPLLLFSLISAGKSQEIISWLTERKRKINLFAGLIMFGISIYYLFFVFRIFG